MNQQRPAKVNPSRVLALQIYNAAVLVSLKPLHNLSVFSVLFLSHMHKEHSQFLAHVLLISTLLHQTSQKMLVKFYKNITKKESIFIFDLSLFYKTTLEITLEINYLLKKKVN